MRRRAVLWSVLGVAVIAGGCAHTKTATAPTIKEEWVARLPPDQLGGVEQARTEKRQAQDDATRAKVAVNDADNNVSVKKSIKSAADKRVDAAEKALKAAQNTGDQSQIRQAQSGVQQAQQQQQLSQAQLNVAQKQRDLARAKADLADAQLNTHDVRLRQAEYQALKQNGDTRVKKIDPLEFDRAIAASRNKEREAQMKVSNQQSQLAQAQQELRQSTGFGGGGQ